MDPQPYERSLPANRSTDNLFASSQTALSGLRFFASILSTAIDENEFACSTRLKKVKFILIYERVQYIKS